VVDVLLFIMYVWHVITCFFNTVLYSYDL
jgi:hypothetical protein